MKPAEIFKRFIEVRKEDGAWWTEIHVGVQVFSIGRDHATKRDAMWYGKMLSIALERLIDEVAEVEARVEVQL